MIGSFALPICLQLAWPGLAHQQPQILKLLQAAAAGASPSQLCLTILWPAKQRTAQQREHAMPCKRVSNGHKQVVNVLTCQLCMAIPWLANREKLSRKLSRRSMQCPAGIFCNEVDSVCVCSYGCSSTCSLASMRACKPLMMCCLASLPYLGGALRDSIAKARFSSLLKSCRNHPCIAMQLQRVQQ